MFDLKSFYKNKSVLVTGGAGLIGSAFVEELLNLEARVFGVQHKRSLHRKDEYEWIKGDLRLMEDCRRACRGRYMVVHSAGVSGGSKKVRDNGLGMFTDTLLMSVSMLEAARLEGVKEYLFVSNSSVYPASVRPCLEEMGQTGMPENETGEVKRACEAQCSMYYRQSGMKISIIRTGNAYGPRDNFDLETSHVLPALMHKAIVNNGPFKMWGEGKAIRDFIHTSDIALGGLYVAANGIVNQPVNIASGHPISIREVVSLLLDITETSGRKIEMTPSPPPASPVKLLDVTRMNQIGFKPRLNLEEGLSQTLNWFIRQNGLNREAVA